MFRSQDLMINTLAEKPQPKPKPRPHCTPPSVRPPEESPECPFGTMVPTQPGGGGGAPTSYFADLELLRRELRVAAGRA